MTQQQFETRKERANKGTLVASRAEDGFRVYSIQHPSRMYAVRKEGDRWTCTCPDFEFHKTDATWRCEHILAVAPWQQNGEVTPQAHSNEGIEARANPDDPQRPSRKKRQNKDVPSPAQMLIKRSISPDGRINNSLRPEKNVQTRELSWPQGPRTGFASTRSSTLPECMR